MSTPPPFPSRFLQASFQPPESQISLLDRRRLTDCLESALRSRLLLLVAPAGCGKSTLLAQWFRSLRARDIPCAWLHIIRETEPEDLLLSICWALQLAGIEISDTGLLSDMIDKAEDAQERLAALLSAVAQVDEPVVLIIDEFERVHGVESLALMELLIAACPPNMHIVLGTRRRPAFSLSALHTHGLVKTLSVDDLVFSDDEARSLLSGVMQSEDVERILRRTEGWPVALTLVKLWWRQSAGRSANLLEFSGNLADVSRYLAENVIAGVGEDAREFLLDVAVLEQVSPKMADALRGREDSVAFLHTLLDLRPLVTVLDSAVPIVRLHPLLAEHLSQTLRVRDSRRFAWLHEQAAREYFRTGRLLEGVRHALEADQPALACELLVAAGPVRICTLQGSAEISACLRLLPELERRRYPRLRLCEIFLLMRRGEHARADAEYRMLREQPEDPSAEYLHESFTIDGLLGLHDPPFAVRKLEELEAAYRACRQPSSWARMVIETLALIVHLRAGRLEAARQCIEIQRTEYAGIPVSTSASYTTLHSCHVLLAEGRLADAEAGLRKTLRMTRTVVGPERAMTIMVRCLLAHVHYETDSEEISEAEIESLLNDLQRTDAWFDYYAIAYAVAIELAYRSSAQAASRLVSKGRIAARQQVLGASFEQLLLTFEADILAREGNCDAAARWLESLDGVADKLTTFYERDAFARTSARQALARNQPDKALAIASDWLTQALMEGRAGAVCRARLFQSSALLRLGEPERSCAVLSQSLSWAASESVIAPFIELRPLTTELFEALDAAGLTPQGAPPEFLKTLRERAAQAPELRRLYGMLTRRESEILEFLRHSASNKHIARAAAISEDAVKYHLKNIYRKLGVHSRSEALRTLAEAQSP